MLSKKILSDGKPNMVQSDKGTEFLNSTFQSMLKRHAIKFYTSENEDLKAAVVERFNRTLQQNAEDENVSLFYIQEYETLCRHFGGFAALLQ